MSHIGVFFAEGFEEIEGLTVVDLCKRAGIETDMVSITDEKMVMGSHKIPIIADITLKEVDFGALDMIVLPGGLKGTQGLEACEPLMKQVDQFYETGKYISAICAAPSIFGHRGILKGKDACSYPSFESHLEGANVKKDSAVMCENVTTSRGMGCSIDFALAIIERFQGKEAATKIAEQVVYMK